VFIALLMGCASMPRSAELNYIPFQIETYTATTPENIRGKAHFRINLKNESDIVALLEVLAGSGTQASRLDRKRVRLAVDIDEHKKHFLIDAEGNVSDGTMEYALDSLRFEELKRQIDQLVKKH
jgi:hypothetical protein